MALFEENYKWTIICFVTQSSCVAAELLASHRRAASDQGVDYALWNCKFRSGALTQRKEPAGQRSMLRRWFAAAVSRKNMSGAVLRFEQAVVPLE
jgi:hypothetical protein